jgi:hypothetical protein
MDKQLFEKALERTLAEDEIASRLDRLARLDDKADPPLSLTLYLRDRSDAIELAATTELEVLRRVEQELEAAISRGVDEELAKAELPVRTAVRNQRETAAAVTRAHDDASEELEAQRQRFYVQDRSGWPDPSDGGQRRIAGWRRARTRTPDDVRNQALEQLSATKLRVARAAVGAVQQQLQLSKLLGQFRSRVVANASQQPDLEAAQERARSARETALDTLVTAGMLGEVREWLNLQLLAATEARYGDDLSRATATGLSQQENPDWEIQTDTETRLTDLLDRLASGSVGISGPRGSGKTTLIRAFCRGGRKIRDVESTIHVMVAAPVKFDPREFLLHLFEKVCRAVLPADVNVRPLGDSDWDRRARLAAGTAMAAVIIGAASVVAGFGLIAHGVGDASLSEESQRLLVGGALATAGSLAMLAALSTWEPVAFGMALAVQLVLGIVVVLTGSFPDLLYAFAGLGGVMALFLTVTASWFAVRLVSGSFALIAGGALALAGIVVAATSPDAGAVSDTLRLGAFLMLGSGLAGAFGLPLLPRRDERSEPYAGDRHAERIAMIVVVNLTGALVSVAVAAGLVGGALVVLGLLGRAFDGTAATGIVLALGGAAAASSCGRGYTFARRERERLAEGESWERSHADAFEHLRRIRFLQTHSASWSGKVAVPGSVKLPFSAEASLGGGRSVAELPLTLPELVDSFKTFLREEIGSKKRALIGIDELDKIDSDEDAQRFLNVIKAVFGVPNCFFLISVSEEAAANFERRGMPFRDAFDSAFDEILRVHHLDLAGAERLLRKRTLETSLPFVAVCHILSGGVARDLVRVARTMFALRDSGTSPMLAPLCSALTAHELKVKRDGTVTAVRRLGGDVDTTAALRWLGAWEPVLTRENVLRAPPPAAPAPPDLPEARSAAFSLDRLLTEFAAACWLGVTIVEFFATPRSPADYERAEKSGVPDGIDRLTEARQALAVDPELACGRIAEFRQEWRLGPPDTAETPIGEVANS